MPLLKNFLVTLVCLFVFQHISAQEIVMDSLILHTNKCNRKHKKISFTLENHTGQELLRVGPMQPLQLFKWANNEWVQVAQIGYCACGMYPCPPPPELLPFADGEKLLFEWDQMESRCTDREKGTIESKWSGKGKYKIIFEFKKTRESESFQLVKEYKIR